MPGIKVDYNAGNYLTPVTPNSAPYFNASGQGLPMENVDVTAKRPASTPSTGSTGGNAWSNLLTGDNLTGLGNLISAFTGKGNTQYPTQTTTAVATGNNTWLIVGGLFIVGLLAWFLLKKD